MKQFLSGINAKTKALIAFLVFNMTATQFEWARDKVIPLLVSHPKISGIVLSVFGLLIAIHNPQVQKFLHEIDTPPSQDVPAEPGAVVDNVKVVTKE